MPLMPDPAGSQGRAATGVRDEADRSGGADGSAGSPPSASGIEAAEAAQRLDFQWGGGATAGDPVPEGATLSLPGDGGVPAAGGSGTFELAPPGAFGKYQLLGEIGRGGMGVVYRARQRDLDRDVAIKMILASHLASAEQVARFYAEARAAARVEHPHIVGIHEVGQIAGQHYFAMEYVAGQSLAKRLHQGPLPPEAAARCVWEVALAVEHLHAQGIVHRDLKPSNILLDGAGLPYVTDFGLAKMLTGDGDLTRTGSIIGTPSYMSPEQAAGITAEIGPRSDVYALGAILYELLTGRPPFSEANPLETLVQVLEGEPPRPGQLRPRLPRELEWICLRCLEKSPADRYPSAAALAADLGRFLHGEPVEARRTGLWDRTRRWARREPALVSRLGTMGIVGAIIQMYHYLLENLEERTRVRSIAVVIAWALVSLACRGLLRAPRRAVAGRYVWAWTDIVLFTLLVRINRGLATPMVAGYFVLVVASGLWFRERLVWFTTAMAVVGYGMLVLIEAVDRQAAPASPYRHLVFAAVLAVSGLIVAYQVKRVRALSHYFEARSLP
ncbi:MAG TPA: serine/threonine-protein kinase [Isosphaeraceae bacterium]